MTDQPNSNKTEFVPMGALAVASLFWSGNFIAGRWIAGTIDPLELNLLRWIFSFCILLPLVAKGFVTHWKTLTTHKLWLFALALLGIAGFNALTYKALTLITVVNALLIVATYPVVAVVVGALINGYRPSKIQILGSLVSLFGASFLIIVGPFRGGVDANFTEGVIWMTAAVLSWLVYSLLLPKRPKNLPQDVVLGATAFLGILIMLPILCVKGVGHIELSAESALALTYISVFASVGGFLCWSYGVAGIGAERSGQFIHLMPLFGTILAVIILEERLEWVHFVGALFILSGIVLVNRK